MSVMPFEDVVPSVSFIIPYHASIPQSLFAETLESIRVQTAACDIDTRVITDHNGRGPAWARNMAAGDSKAKWLVLLDADDTIAPTFLEAALAAGMGKCDVVVPSSSPLTEAILRDNYLPYCALIRRSLWVDMGGYTEPSPKGLGLCDWDFWIRVWRLGVPIGYIDPALFQHREREGSLGKTWGGGSFEEMRMDLWKKYGVVQ